MPTMAATEVAKLAIRYQDHAVWSWLRTQAPCGWQGRVDVEFTTVPFRQLEPAGSCTDPAVVSQWLSRMKAGRAVPPPVVCQTERGSFYVHDGNHRLLAMQELFREDDQARIRAAVLVPKPGFRFQYRHFDGYGTYVLEAVERSSPAPGDWLRTEAPGVFSGRTLVLVAHPDDESACAGLLQRLREPVVVFATDGAPADAFFWHRYGSQQNYAAVRRQEATAAVESVGAAKCEFLSECAARPFLDQQLYRALPAAFAAVCRILGEHEPEAVIVPAYEGGHPDHDACSVLGALVHRRLGVAVWEMPLYHRSDSGALVCQRFRQPAGTERMLVLCPEELRKRALMLARYRSQLDLGSYVTTRVEFYRPQPDYDYAAPPHAGTLNYQAWQWPISPTEVCACFSDCMTRVEECTAEPSLRAQVISSQAATACGVV